MTKKDFNELAKQLAIFKPPADEVREYNMWSNCVYAVILACKATSANFDRGRFLTACGVPNIGVP